jgi:hypothetical protein
MPGKRIPQLDAIAGASTANDDNLVIYDTDAGTTKRILRSQLAAGLVGDLPYTPAGFIAATTVPTAIAEIASDLSASSGSSLVGFLQSGTSATARTTQAKLRDVVSVLDFGADPTGGADSTVAIQAAINYCLGGSGGTAYENAKKLEFSNGVYAISKPLLIGGDSLFIEGNDCTIVKTTNDLPASTLPNISADVPGGAVDPNQNAIFITSTRLRFSTIQNFNLGGVSGTSTPIAIWGVGNENTFRNLFIRNVSIGLQIPSMWMTTIAHCVVRSPTSHGFWWTNARVSGTGQSGTSLHFDNCAVFGAAGKGFYIQDADYITLSACACDGSTEEAYWFSGVTGLNAAIAFEDMNPASVTPAIRCASGTTGVITLDSFDSSARAYPVIKTTQSKITVFGRISTDYSYYFDCTLASIVNAQGLQIIPVSGSELDNAKFVTDSDSHIYYTLAAGTVGSTQYIYHFNNSVRWDETLVNPRVLNHTTAATPETSGTITLETGSDVLAYTQQGRIVHIQGQATIASVGSPVGGYVNFSLPIASASTLAENGDRSGGACMYRDNGTLTVQTKPYWLLSASSTFRVYIDASTLVSQDIFNFSFSYFVD